VTDWGAGWATHADPGLLSDFPTKLQAVRNALAANQRLLDDAAEPHQLFANSEVPQPHTRPNAGVRHSHTRAPALASATATHAPQYWTPPQPHTCPNAGVRHTQSPCTCTPAPTPPALSLTHSHIHTHTLTHTHALSGQLGAQVVDPSTVTEGDAEKVRSTLRQCVRDWSEEVRGYVRVRVRRARP
jgi:hypothetical protein